MKASDKKIKKEKRKKEKRGKGKGKGKGNFMVRLLLHGCGGGVWPLH